MPVSVPIGSTIQAEGTYPPGGSIPIGKGIEGASQAYKKGAPLINSSGKLVIASGAPLDTADSIVGFALRDATGVTDSEVLYVPALKGIIVFSAMLEDNVNFNHVLAQANQYTKYVILEDTTSKAWFLDENNTTNGIALVIGFQSDVGTTKGRVYFILTGGTLA